jgi:hypothetical protein
MLVRRVERLLNVETRGLIAFEQVAVDGPRERGRAIALPAPDRDDWI